jgi:hypothetical protein
MLNNMRNEKAFTLTEVMVAIALSTLVIAVVLPVWTMTSGLIRNESTRTEMRIDLMTSLETIKSELRLTNLNYLSMYPEGAGPYTAISFPAAVTDADGFFSLNAAGDIEWDNTVIYHLYPETDGSQTLRKTVIPLRDNSMTATERLLELENVAVSGEGPEGSVTTDFLENIDEFEVESLSPIIDFYDSSGTPVRVGKVTFGWAQLGPGEHTIRFTITGSNPDSSGTDIGIDSLMIEPSGSTRDVEYYATEFAPLDALTTSGGTVGPVYSPEWSNNGYLEFSSDGENSYIEIKDSYDLWRESSFDNISMDNVLKTGDEARIYLELPENGEPGAIDWMATVEAGEEKDMFLPDSTVPPMVIRNIVTSTNIAEPADVVRLKLKSASDTPLTIGRVYITRRDPDFDEEVDIVFNGVENPDPSGLTPGEYHMHQQIFFEDSGAFLPGVTIPANSEVWSVWTAFPLATDSNYLVSIYLSDAADTESKGFEGDVSRERSSYIDASGWLSCTVDSLTDVLTAASHSMSEGDPVIIFANEAPSGVSVLSSSFPEMAGTPFWHYYAANVTADTFQLSALEDGSDIVDMGSDGTDVFCKKLGLSNDILVSAEIDGRVVTGTVTSGVFDTALAAPVYSELKWSEYSSENTEIALKVRSAPDRYMSGADSWDLVAAITDNPAVLPGAGNRYVQFRAQLTSSAFWEDTTGIRIPPQISYEDYISEQRTLPVYDFPQTTEYLVSGVSPVWVDDIEIKWDGVESLCALTGYVAKKNDYGQAKITVDGADLEKILRVFIRLSTTDFTGRNIVEENYIDIEPRNTGK